MEDEKQVAPVSAPTRAAVPDAAKVTMRHPHTGDTVTVNAAAAEFVPYMLKGYEQVQAGGAK